MKVQTIKFKLYSNMMFSYFPIGIKKIGIFCLFCCSLSSASCSNRWLINHYTYTSYQTGSKDTAALKQTTLPIGSPYQELRNENGMDIVVTARKMRSTKNFGETIQLLDQNQDVIYPGSIVSVSNKNFEIKPLNDKNLRRSPLNIIIPTNSTNASIIVEKPDAHTINEAKAKLIQSIDLQKIAGKLEYSETELNDYQSSMQELGLNANWFVKIEEKFRKAQATKKNVLWVRFKQVNYSIVCEGFNEPAAYFLTDSADAGAVAAFIKNISFGNPPCYVAQIDYGRTFLIQLSSTMSVDTMKSMLSVGFKGIGAEFTSEFNRSSHDITAEIISNGGNPEDWSDIPSTMNFLTLRNKIQQVISKGMNPNSPAVPVSMVLRHLSDRSPVCINSSVEYTLKEEYCGFVPKEYILDSIEVSVFPHKEGGESWDPYTFDWFKPGAAYPDIFAKIGNSSTSEISDALHGWLKVNKVINLTGNEKHVFTFFDNDVAPDPTGEDFIGKVEFSANDLLKGRNDKPVNILKPIELFTKSGQLYKVNIAIHPK